jgi:regulator of protease activity HflC (stomatin/prohibitin superfamily)
MLDEEQKGIASKIVIGLVVFFVFITLMGTFKIVPAGKRGVVLRMGAVNRVMVEGINGKIPYFESVQITDVRTQKEEVKAEAASKDMQGVTSVIALNFHVSPEAVGLLWQKVGAEYQVKIISPAIQESVKAATAKYTAEELITKRSEVKDAMKLSLSERLQKDYIIVDEVSIVNFDFKDSFNKAIEAKVTAEQEALTQKNKLEQVKYEAEQAIAQANGVSQARVINAKAEAEAIKIQAAAVTQQGGKDYVQLQAIKQWNGILPTQMIPGSTVPFINLAQ